jgi:hypothetical protein
VVAGDLALAEEVLHDELATLAVVEDAVSLQQGTDSLRGEVGVRDLFLGQLLNALQNGLVAHLKYDQLRGGQPVLQHLLRPFFWFLALRDCRHPRKDLPRVLVASGKAIEDVAAVKAVVLSETPAVAFVEELFA